MPKKKIVLTKEERETFKHLKNAERQYRLFKKFQVLNPLDVLRNLKDQPANYRTETSTKFHFTSSSLKFYEYLEDL